MKNYLNLTLILVVCSGLILFSIILFRSDFAREVDEIEGYLENISPVALNEAVSITPGQNCPVPNVYPAALTPDAVTSATPRVIAWVNNIVEQVKPSMVGICVGDTDLVPPWQQGWEVLTPSGKRSVGSGVIVHPQGYVLTNYHVVEIGGPITVSLFDAQGYMDYPAELVAGEKKFDLAVLKIVADRSFSHVSVGNSDKVSAGDKVIAIGNPFGLTQTATSGIISARRSRLAIGGVVLRNVLQTDVPINPGNSGGALLNIRGEVIGINTAIYSPMESVYTGISFAISINQAKKLFSNFIDTTKKVLPVNFQYTQMVQPEYRYVAGQAVVPADPLAGKIQPSPGEGIEELAWLGIDMVPENDADTTKSEVQVDEIEGITPMEAGLEAGDIIKSINGYPTPSIYEIKEAIKKVPLKVGQGVVLLVERPRNKQTLYISFRMKKWDIKGR